MWFLYFIIRLSGLFAVSILNSQVLNILFCFIFKSKWDTIRLYVTDYCIIFTIFILSRYKNYIIVQVPIVISVSLVYNYSSAYL